MDSFHQRIVKVVLPTLEAKAAWAEAAGRDGFEENVSGWVRTVVAKHMGGESKRLAQEANRTGALAEKVQALESELQLVRDAYQKARADLLALSKRYDELAGDHAGWVAEAERERANKIFLGFGLSRASGDPEGLKAAIAASKPKAKRRP